MDAIGFNKLNELHELAERLGANNGTINIIDNETKKEVSIKIDYTSLRSEIITYCINHKNEMNELCERYDDISKHVINSIKQLRIIINRTEYDELYNNEMCFKANNKHKKLGLYTVVIYDIKFKCRLIDVYSNEIAIDTHDFNDILVNKKVMFSKIKLIYEILRVDSEVDL